MTKDQLHISMECEGRVYNLVVSNDWGRMSEVAIRASLERAWYEFYKNDLREARETSYRMRCMMYEMMQRFRMHLSAQDVTDILEGKFRAS